MGQKMDLLYHETMTYAETASGAWSEAGYLDTVPLKVRVKGITVMLEADTAFNKALLVQVVVSPEDNSASYLHEDVNIGSLLSKLKDNTTARDTANVYFTPDNKAIFYFLMFGSNDDEWQIQTQDVDFINDMSKQGLAVEIRLDSYDAAALTAGALDLFVIVETEVLC